MRRSPYNVYDTDGKVRPIKSDAHESDTRREEHLSDAL